MDGRGSEAQNSFHRPHTGYKPPTTAPAKKPSAAGGGAKATKASPSSSSRSSSAPSNKPGPLATLFEVYTRGAGDKAAALSPEEAALKRDRQYTLITGLPLKPYFERKTVRRQIGPDMWTLEQVGGYVDYTCICMCAREGRGDDTDDDHDPNRHPTHTSNPYPHQHPPQPQGFFNVTTPIRTTVVRLQDGRLWVHAPVAPTKECLRLLGEIGGEVAYIVLPTTAFEHKVGTDGRTA